MMAKSGICICAHPESWHDQKTEKMEPICVGKFCRCPVFQPTHFAYDEEAWVRDNYLKPIKGER